MLRDERRMDATLTFTLVVETPSIPCYSLEDALTKVATPIQSVKGEDTFNSFTDRPMLDERSVLRTRRTQSASSNLLEDTERKDI